MIGNNVLWILFIIVNLALVVLLYRLAGKYGLYAVIVAATICANIQVVKTVELFGLVATLGNVLYASVFFATDLLAEIYGKNAARRGVWLGFAGMLLMTLWMQASLYFTPDASDFAQESLQTIFGLMPRIALGSMVAYLVSQHHDIFAYSYWRKKTNGRFLWLRNNASTMVSQAIDSVLFCLIAFWGVFELNIWLQILATTYVFKWIVALFDTPFIYLAKHTSEAVLKKEKGMSLLEPDDRGTV